jgi:predicted transcriptional regulator
MTKARRTIEIDEDTATRLERRAAERGMSVSQLVAEFVSLESQPVAVEADQVSELDHRWAEVRDGQPTVANSDVVRWLETCGTPAFRPWNNGQ